MPGTTIVHADGTREYIADPRSIEEQRAAAKSEMRQHATAALLAVWPSWKQTNAALGVYGEEGRLACQAAIMAVRAETDVLDAAIDASDALGLDVLNLNPWG
ncbi:MAG: hypothetical protein JHC81_04955 [Brevundimonas sp.]|uniref:hypothetical protein n=1 Tax=Brevundimonas sp. TaxID=1871086 RepID=UPI001A26CE24|nr:hypothetical protein [Brevundimonas sp.]MBJ7446864.1 hypothetical protein [Brevundimonas sp.]